MKISTPENSSKRARLLLYLLLFVGLLGIFWKVLLPGIVLFSNDGSLAIINSTWIHMPEAFVGAWSDLNSLGINGGSVVPDFTQIFRWIFGAVGYAKFLAPVSLWFFGAAAFFFFRRAGLSAMASILGGLAACFTTAYFSNVCWGSIPPTIAFGMDLLAMGALIKRDKLAFWIAPALAGFAVGINVIEGADVGAIFSVLVAVFAMYQAVTEEGATLGKRLATGVGRTAIMTCFAMFIAAYAVFNLISANITNIAGTQQTAEYKESHYDFATQWSLPKAETVSLFVPNVFGGNVLSPGGANYWGGMGRDAAWDRYFASDKKGPPPTPDHYLRHTGRQFYIGSLVVLIAFWAGLQSLRKKDSPFTTVERRFVWFWWVIAFGALVMAWGRFAPLYHIAYQLPYFSTIRNPEKFLHIVTLSMVILFAYGIHGLHRRYLEVPLLSAPQGRFKAWWAKASTFDRRWVVASLGIVLLSVAALGIYAALRGQVEDHLTELQRLYYLSRGTPLEAEGLKGVQQFSASQVSFSLTQVVWFILVLAVSTGVLLAITCGTFAGRRARWAGVLLGVILLGDLVRADLPYVVFWNYKDKYEVGHLEPVVDFLNKNSYEHRVAYIPPQPLITPKEFGNFQSLYHGEWTQQLFDYYSIPTLDIVQMPRTPEDLNAFNNALQIGIIPGTNGPQIDEKTMYRFGRMWQLSATRYLVGPLPYFEFMNQKFDTAPNRFRIVQKFNLGLRPGVDSTKQSVSISDIAAVPTDNPNAEYGLFEYTAALPRAALFSDWEVVTNDQAALAQLASASFDPAKTVLLAKPLPANAKPSGASPELNSVKFTSYKPATILLEASPTAPSVLMICDRTDPNWYVLVDGKPAEVLRCNYLMRGVYLEPGHHQVEFRFRPNVNMFYVNVAATIAAIALLGYAVVTTRRRAA